MSPLLALVRDGGRRRLVFGAPQPYVTKLVIRLSNRGKGIRPEEATFLYNGGGFNQDYNLNHPPMTLEVPPYARRTELAALVTGHGWGAEIENCAEFCN